MKKRTVLIGFLLTALLLTGCTGGGAAAEGDFVCTSGMGNHTLAAIGDTLYALTQEASGEVILHSFDRAKGAHTVTAVEVNSDELFANPLHPYTQALLSAIPVPKLEGRGERIILRGEIVSPINLPKACRFAARCNNACERCHAQEPELKESSPGHWVSCFGCE